jgi:hypothetical protein
VPADRMGTVPVEAVMAPPVPGVKNLLARLESGSGTVAWRR